MLNSGSDNNLNTIAQRMKQAAEQQRLGVEKIIEQQFNELSLNLSRSSKDALTTTENVIQQQLASLEKNITLPCRTLSWTFAKRWLQTFLISGAVLLGITLSGWGLFTMAQNKIASLAKEISDLKTAKASAEQGYQEVITKFKGISLVQQDGRDYLILPRGYKGTVQKTVEHRYVILLEKGF